MRPGSLVIEEAPICADRALTDRGFENESAECGLAELDVNKRPRLTPPSLGRSIAWLADRRRDPTPINKSPPQASCVRVVSGSQLRLACRRSSMPQTCASIFHTLSLCRAILGDNGEIWPCPGIIACRKIGHNHGVVCTENLNAGVAVMKSAQDGT
jgi:hypothetical protein